MRDDAYVQLLVTAVSIEKEGRVRGKKPPFQFHRKCNEISSRIKSIEQFRGNFNLSGECMSVQKRILGREESIHRGGECQETAWLMEMKNYNVVQLGDSASYRVQKNEAEERGRGHIKEDLVDYD